MSKQIGVISGRVELNSVEFTKNLAAMKRELRTLKTDTELAKRGFDVFGDGVTGSGNVLKTLENQIQLSGQQMKRYSDDFNKAMKENDGQFTRASQNAQRNFKRMQLEVAKMAEEYYKATLEQERANNKWYQGAKTLRETGNQMQKHGKSVQKIGEAWTKVGIAVSLGAGAIMKTAIDFESGVVEMQKTIDTTETKFAELTQGVRDLALEIPMAASELAELAAIAGQFGIEEDSILSFTETIAGLSVATDLTSESAGMMLAQFANITEMDHSNFENLGSSIVELGNNLATTESQIAGMAQQLAGAGNAAGMSQADIVGLAGGLSSLGISAERGGSSFSKLIVQMSVASATGIDAMADLEAQTGMTRRELELMASNNSKGFRELAQSLGMTTSEMKDAINASKDLEGYASVAGVTVEEFARIFREDAVGAIGMFIDGLAQGNDETGTAIEILDELGITEIRLRDTLLRTGNAQGLLNDAVKASNDAWTENTALAEEADLFYGSTASQMTILRNKIKDVAIELGTALLPVANEFISGLDPMIDGLKGAAEWFTNLDEGTQKLIASATGILIIGGPFVKLLGSTMVGVGKLTSGVGDLGMKLFDVKNHSEALSKTKDMLKRSIGELTGPAGFGGFIKTLGSAGAGAGTAIGGMVLAAGKAIALTGAIAGVTLGVGWLIKELVDFGKETVESNKRIEKWGADIDDETEKVLINFQELSNGVKESTKLMAEDVQAGGQAALRGYSEMVEGITGVVDENIEEIEGFYSGLDTTTKKILEESTTEQIEGLKRVREEAETYHKAINDTYAVALEENRELTEAEMNRIESYHRKLAELQAEALGGTEEQIRQTQAVLMETLEGMTAEQLQKRYDMLSEDLKMTKEHHAEQLAMLEEQHAAGIISEEEYQSAVLSMRQANQREILDIMDEEIKVQQARNIDEEAMLYRLTQKYSEYGFTREQIEERVQRVLQGTQDEMVAVDQYWQDLLTDPVTGEVITNLPDVLADIAQSDEKWKELNFMIKEANMTTNALQILDQALFASGHWGELDPEVKELLANATGFMTEISKSEEELNRWNALPEEEKLILGNNLDLTMEILESEEMYKRWMDLPEEEKKMLGNNEQLLRKILRSEEKLKEWNRLKPVEKKLLADNSAVFTAVDNAQRKINSLRGKSVTLRTVHESVYTSINRAGSSASSQRAAQSGYTFSYAQGTDYHAGGAAILGDGGRREPFLTPQGIFGVSPATDTLFDLPRGTKVWSSIQNFSSQLKSSANKIANVEIPKFATGTVDFPNMQELLRPFIIPQHFGQTNGQSSVDLSGIQSTLQAILERLSHQVNGGDINIEKIEVQDGEDLKSTMEEMNWILQGEGNRLG